MQFTGWSTSQCFKINLALLWVVEQCQWSVPFFSLCLILWLSLAILLNALLNLHLPVFSLCRYISVPKQVAKYPQNNMNTIIFKMQCHYEYLPKHTKIVWVQRPANKESSQSGAIVKVLLFFYLGLYIYRIILLPSSKE